MKYLIQGISVQNKRSSNMDRIFYERKSIDGNEILVAVVCDGVGSLQNGAYAAELVTKYISAWVDDVDEIKNIGLNLRDYIIKVNSEILNHAKENQLKTATTMSLILIVNRRYYIINVGDSRVYRIKRDANIQITVDDVDDKNRITSCIGAYEYITPQYYEDYVDCEGFLLCSDGIYKKLDMISNVEFNLKSDNKMKKSLSKTVDLAILNGETDNISAILIKIKE